MVAMENASKEILIGKCWVPDAYSLEDVMGNLMADCQTSDLPKDRAKEIMIQGVNLGITSQQARVYSGLVVST